MVFRSGYFSSWKKHKFNAKRTQCGDHYHPSQLEARVCGELQMRLKAGDIKDFVRQRPIPIFGYAKSGKELYSGKSYKVDFYVTHNDGTIEFVEAKGMEMADWWWKWFLLQCMYHDDPIYKFRVVK